MRRTSASVGRQPRRTGREIKGPREGSLARRCRAGLAPECREQCRRAHATHRAKALALDELLHEDARQAASIEGQLEGV